MPWHRPDTTSSCSSESATWRQPLSAIRVESFSTTESLAAGLQSCADPGPLAIFHAAAVSDYQAGSLRILAPDGTITPPTPEGGQPRGTILLEWCPLQNSPPPHGWFPPRPGSPDGNMRWTVRPNAVARGERVTRIGWNPCLRRERFRLGAGFAWLRRGLPLVQIPSRRMLLDSLVSCDLVRSESFRRPLSKTGPSEASAGRPAARTRAVHEVCGAHRSLPAPGRPGRILLGDSAPRIRRRPWSRSP